MKRSALIIGQGDWATTIAGKLRESKGFRVQQVSARALLENQTVVTLGTTFDLLVFATRPSFQEQLIAMGCYTAGHIWIEKPIATTCQGAQTLLSILESKKDTYCLVNFSWLFSEVWQKVTLLNIDSREIANIKISRSASKEVHTYMKPTEDYGSHDIALIADLLTHGSKEGFRIQEREFGLHEFQSTISGISIEWNIEFEKQKKEMIWSIKYRNGNETTIDFYANAVVHNGKYIHCTGSDNLDNFINKLMARDIGVQEQNHVIALIVKEFFTL